MKSAVKHQTIDLSKTQEKGDKILQEMLNISLEGSHQDTDEVSLSAQQLASLEDIEERGYQLAAALP